jgi:hypothetical protein
MRKLSPLLALGLLVGLTLGGGGRAVAQQAIRLFGTTSAGNPIAVKTDANGNMLVTAGTSSGYFPFILSTSTTQVGTDANLNEKDLWTYSLTAGHLSTNGHAIRFTAYGTLAANANNKTLKGYFGATQCGALSTTASGSHWEIRCLIMRTGAATQNSGGVITIGLGNTNVTHATPAETLSGAVTVKVTGQNGTASANDIVFRTAIVESLK